MKATVSLGIGAKLTTFGVHLTAVLQVSLVEISAIIVGVDEVIAGVIRRVDVNQLDLAEIRLLQKFQHFQIVALDDEIFSGVKVDDFSRRWD